MKKKIGIKAEANDSVADFKLVDTIEKQWGSKARFKLDDKVRTNKEYNKQFPNDKIVNGVITSTVVGIESTLFNYLSPI